MVNGWSAPRTRWLLTRSCSYRVMDLSVRPASRYESGRTDESIALYEQLLVSSQRVLGDDHPFTMAMCEELEDVRRELKQRDNPSAD